MTKFSDKLKQQFKEEGLSDSRIIERLLELYDRNMEALRQIMANEVGVSLGVEVKRLPEEFIAAADKANLKFGS